MYKRKKKDLIEHESMIGRIIDMPMQEFKNSLVEQRVNVGTMNNLILNLEGAYNECRMRKQAVLDLVFKGLKTKEEVQTSINGLYAEMTKLEEKIVYLKERAKELVNVDKPLN